MSAFAGPSNGQIRVMDVRSIPETGQIIAIVAGTDKDISVWDVKQNDLINSLSNGSIKPVVCLAFHPTFPELFISADMDFDVKLWNWKEGSLVRWWKKHHSRIIYQLDFLPGDDTRFAGKIYSFLGRCHALVINL
jgi:WD40 repeat protein